MPRRSTIFVDTNVAATPISAQSPLNPPIMVGFKPDKLKFVKVNTWFSWGGIKVFRYHHSVQNSSMTVITRGHYNINAKYKIKKIFIYVVNINTRLYYIFKYIVILDAKSNKLTLQIN